MKEDMRDVDILLGQIRAALERGDPKSAAELLEVDRVTVYNKMKKYGITR